MADPAAAPVLHRHPRLRPARSTSSADTIASVLAQEHDRLGVDPGRRRVPGPRRTPRDRRAAAEQDPRIRLVERATNGHIVAASNDAVAEARGEFLVFLDHDDLLTPDALAEMARAIAAEPEVDYLYSDEDKVGADGQLLRTLPPSRPGRPSGCAGRCTPRTSR